MPSDLSCSIKKMIDFTVCHRFNSFWQIKSMKVIAIASAKHSHSTLPNDEWDFGSLSDCCIGSFFCISYRRLVAKLVEDKWSVSLDQLMLTNLTIPLLLCFRFLPIDHLPCEWCVSNIKNPGGWQAKWYILFLAKRCIISTTSRPFFLSREVVHLQGRLWDD